MSNPMQQMLSAGLRALEGVSGCQTFTYNGQEIPCLISTLMRGTELEIGGKLERLELTLTVRKEAITPIFTAGDEDSWNTNSAEPGASANIMPPHPGKRVVVNSRPYRILSVREDGAGASWRIDLGSVER